MTSRRLGAVAEGRRQVSARRPLRLDLLVNPYGPSLQVQDVLGSSDELHLPAEARAREVALRLARLVGVPSDWLILGNGVDDLLNRICRWRREGGPMVLFPPCHPADEQRARAHGIDVVSLRRGPSFSLDLDLETAAELPAGATALISSPNDPTGNLLGSQEAVRLARACELVVIDERHGEYSGRTMLPLVREFDNVLILRTFETWAGLAGLPFAYAIGPPRLIRDFADGEECGGVAMGAVLAAAATLDDLAYVQATTRRVREERSRLYRTLRKLNMVRPLPSWANFLLVHVERGDATSVHRRLGERGAIVYRPPQPELRDFLRVSATKPEQTDVLKQALIEIAADL